MGRSFTKTAAAVVPARGANSQASCAGRTTHRGACIVPIVAGNILAFIGLIPVFGLLLWWLWRTRGLLENGVLEYVWTAYLLVTLLAGFGVLYFGARVLGIDFFSG